MFNENLVIEEYFGEHFPNFGTVDENNQYNIIPNSLFLRSFELYDFRFEESKNFAQIFNKKLNKNIDVTLKIYPDILIESYKIDMTKLFFEIIENNVNFKNFNKQYKHIHKEKNEILEYESDLIKTGGKGYEKIFENELFELNKQLINLFMDDKKNFTDPFNETINNMFFNGQFSSVKDLTTINGVKCFDLSQQYRVDWNKIVDFTYINNDEQIREIVLGLENSMLLRNCQNSFKNLISSINFQ